MAVYSVYVIAAILVVLWITKASRSKYRAGRSGRKISSAQRGFAALVLTGGGFASLALFSTNFISFYSALEGLSLVTFFCIARHTLRAGAKELFLKYFCFSSFTSVLLIAGLSLLYLVTQSLDFQTIKLMLFLHKQALHGNALGESNTLALAIQLLTGAIWLVTTSFLFKLGAYPFHFLLPDIYEAGSIAFLSFYNFVLKVAYYLLLLMLIMFLFAD